MNTLHGKTILVGVTGGIAAYKTCSLVSKLTQSGASVHVMMTRNATEFVAPLSFETLSHNRVIVDTFDRDFTWEVEHVSLAKKADAVIVAPATANVIAKLACGIADDFLTTTVLACAKNIVVAPAMNTAMMTNPVTAANINTLISRGYTMIYGGDGMLACGDVGVGRMAEPETLFDELCKLLCGKTDYTGKTVLVTAGATRAELDPVRFISNRSSGKMGYAIARAAYARGANIVFVKGYCDNFVLPNDWIVEGVQTTSDMASAVKKHASDCDVYIMAAAPCDYEVAPSPQKLKAHELTLALKKATDIAKWVGSNKGEGKLVIFAAETENTEKNARGKLESKNADLVVANDVTKPGAGFDVDTNIATLITKDSILRQPLMKKTELADVILDTISEL